MRLLVRRGPYHDVLVQAAGAAKVLRGVLWYRRADAGTAASDPLAGASFGGADLVASEVDESRGTDSRTPDASGSPVEDGAIAGNASEVEVVMAESTPESRDEEETDGSIPSTVAADGRNFFRSVFNQTMIDWWVDRSQHARFVRENFATAEVE